MNTIADLMRMVRTDLQDNAKKYWSDINLIDNLNKVRAELYGIRPRLYEVTEPLSLVDGTVQTVPNGSKFLFNVAGNESHISRRTVTVVDAELLSRGRPNWRGEAQSDLIYHFMYDEMSPTRFEVYPPAQAGTVVTVSYSKPPSDFAVGQYSSTDPALLAAESTIEGALFHGVIFFCYSKSSDASPVDLAKAQMHYQAFTAMVIGEQSAKSNTSANTNSAGGKPQNANK